MHTKKRYYKIGLILKAHAILTKKFALFNIKSTIIMRFGII